MIARDVHTIGTQVSRRRFPADWPREPSDGLKRARTLRGWRDASAMTSAAMAVLLPFAITWHTPYPTAIASCLAVTALVTYATHLARRVTLSMLSVHPECIQHQELAYKRRQLVSPRSRRALAQGLRSAAKAQAPARAEICPILCDRVAPLRRELVQVAAALEQTAHPDPASVALIHELLREGRSPLYDPSVPAADLEVTLRRVRVVLQSQLTWP
jgi:hypothetical protein